MLTNSGTAAASQAIIGLQSDAGVLLIALLVIVITMFRSAPAAYASFSAPQRTVEYRFSTPYHEADPIQPMVIYLPRTLWEASDEQLLLSGRR